MADLRHAAVHRAQLGGNVGTLLVVCRGKANQVLTYHTVDGGNLWSLASTLPVLFGAASFSSPATGVRCGYAGGEWTTADGGATWQQVAEPANLSGAFSSGGWVASVDAVDAAHMGLVLERGGYSDSTALFVTKDGGSSWQVETVGPPAAPGAAQLP